MSALKITYYNFKEEKSLLDKDKLVISFANDKPCSFYSDDIWDFSYENSNNLSLHEKVLLNFNQWNKYPKIKEAVKDGLYKLLSNGLKSTTLMVNYKYIKGFLKYITQELNIYDLNTLKIEHIRLYISFVMKQNISHSTCTKKILFLENLFFKYRDELKYKLNFHPFEGKTPSKILNKSISLKNSIQTEIIPDITWKKIISLAIKKIKDYQSNSEIEKTLHDYWINEYDEKVLNKEKVLNFKKIFDYSSFINQVNGLTQYKNITEYKEYTKEVIISCGILIQAFTGMRISEMMSLKRGCCIEEIIEFNTEKVTIKKLNGITFKYQTQMESNKTGKEADWFCPEIVAEAIKVLESIHRASHHIFKDKNIEEHLFITSALRDNPRCVIYSVYDDYKSFLENNGIDIDFKLTSHCFRRTLARFFARNLLNLPVEALKEQFKHFSKDITLYYMKEDLKNDGSFNELIEDYINNQNDKLLFEEVRSKFNNSILSANNIDDIRIFVSGKQVNLINDYMATISKNNKGISPLKSLTCEGTIILPGIHLDYWKEMLILYKELIELEPNSIWYKSEHKMIEDVVISLENGNAYIVKGK